MTFSAAYRNYIKNARKGTDFGFSLKRLAGIEPILEFLYRRWWHVDLQGLQRLPQEGPALIVGNSGGPFCYPGLMLVYAMMNRKKNPRRINILCEMDWIEDERVHSLARELGFVPWSADNARSLFEKGELVAAFPEGIQGAIKPYAERYRLRSFDWTRILPAMENKIPIYPMATLGADESLPILTNLDGLAKWLDIPAFPVTPFMPFLPFPLNLMSLSGKWRMRIMKPTTSPPTSNRNELYETAFKLAQFLEGEVQSELNRLLRQRIKFFI